MTFGRKIFERKRLADPGPPVETLRIYSLAASPGMNFDSLTGQFRADIHGHGSAPVVRAPDEAQ
jgi:hypothetical protein